MTKENLNGRIHDKIIKSSELFLARESNQNVSLINALDWLNEIVDDENLNEVTEIYIYEEAFGDLNTKLKNTVVHAITSIVAFNYNNDNIAYLENLVIMDDGLKSDIAFDYLLKIGGYHEKFRDNIFLFIEKNFNDFSKNKLNILAFYLASIYPKESRVTSLLEFVVDFHKKKYPSTKSGSGSKNENEIQNNENKTARILEIETDEEKPWWKFW